MQVLSDQPSVAHREALRGRKLNIAVVKKISIKSVILKWMCCYDILYHDMELKALTPTRGLCGDFLFTLFRVGFFICSSALR